MIIGLSGASGSGKTTFIRSIQEMLEGKDVSILSQDHYYKPRTAQKKDDLGYYNFDLPESLEINRFYQDMMDLKAGKGIILSPYVFNNQQNTQGKKSNFEIQPAPVILVEGLFLFHDPLIRDVLDLKILINASENTCFNRRLHRDQKERNYAVEEIKYRYRAHVLPAYEKYIQPYTTECDLIINNNRGFDKALEVLVAFIKQHLPKG